MKGQIFLITAVLIVLLLGAMRLQTAVEPRSAMSPQEFENLKAEFGKTVELSLLNGESVSANLDSFKAYSINSFSLRGYTEQVNYQIINPTTVQIELYLGKGSQYMKDSWTISKKVY